MLTRRSRVDMRLVLALVAVILAGTALRIWIGWWLGHLGDLDTFRRWALDPGEPIRPPKSHLPINYPPIYVSLLRLMRWVHRALALPGDFTASVQLAPDVSVVRPIILYLKTPAIVADALCTVLIFRIGARLGRPAMGLASAALYTFSPAILYDGAYYGQTDTIQFALCLAALACVIWRRPFLLGFVGTAAFLFKAQSFVTLMVVTAALAGQWRDWWPQWRRLLAGGVSALTLTFALAAWTGQLPRFIHGYVGITHTHPRVSNNALNVWWLAMRPWDRTPLLMYFPDDTIEVLPGLTARTLGLILFFAAMAIILWRLHRARYTPHALVLAAACAGWAFFLLPTQMHERYSVPAVGFMCVLVLWERRWLIWASIASIAVMLNTLLAAYFLFPPARWLQYAVNAFLWTEHDRAWTAVAVLLTLMLPVCLDALWRQGRPAAQVQDSGAILSAARKAHKV